MANLIIINDKIYGDSIGNLNKIFYETAGKKSKIYTLVYDKGNMNLKLEGYVIKGVRFPFTSGWYLNYRFQNIIFRRFIDQIGSDRNAIIIYASQQIRPFNLEMESVIVHDLIPLRYPNYSNKVVTSILKKNLEHYRKLPVIATVSHFTKGNLQEYGFDSKIDVIYNPISDEYRYLNQKSSLRKKLGLPEDKILVLSVSANYPWKNLNLLKSAMDILGPDFKLIRVGSGVGDSINFNRISNEMLNQLYNACDVLILPSSYEGFGIPLVEGMAAGIPVVASDIEVFHEVGGDAVSYTSIDPEGIARAVKEAVSSSDEMRTRGINRSKLFNADNFKARVSSFIEDLLNAYRS